jgi:hypothetical protein
MSILPPDAFRLLGPRPAMRLCWVAPEGHGRIAKFRIICGGRAIVATMEDGEEFTVIVRTEPVPQ